MTPLSRLRWLIATGAVFVFATQVARAHRLDEYLQASLIAVEEDRIEVEVSQTPGSELANWIVPMIDTDGDGKFSDPEANRHAEQVRTNLSLRVDGRSLALTLQGTAFSEPGEIREGRGVLRIRFSANTADLATGAYRLEFRNDYRTHQSVYQANALVPRSRRVTIGRQERDELQTRLEFGFVLAPPVSEPVISTVAVPWWLVVALPVAGATLVAWAVVRRGHNARRSG